MKNLTFLVPMFLLFSTNAYSKDSPLCESIRPLLQSGDLVFMNSNYYLFQKVSEATDTWANHVGIAFERNGEWVIAESKVPLSKVTPLCDYLDRSKDGQIAVRRLPQNFTPQQVEALWESAMSKMNVLYHLGFKLHSPRQFCSKFVYQVYMETLGIEVGEIQTFRQVLEDNPDGSQAFWKWWFLGNIPWDRETVTPKSQLLDPGLTTIYSWEEEQVE